jgi:hypothetical protein
VIFRDPTRRISTNYTKNASGPNVGPRSTHPHLIVTQVTAVDPNGPP